jgi:hypothetical protein
MTNQTEIIDLRAGMAWAMMAPALAGALIGLAGGPFLAIAVFGTALSIAGIHVVLLAVPLYGLLRIAGWRVSSKKVLVAAILIGAMPATLAGGPVLGASGGLFGLIGGVAFCVVSVMREEQGEGE